MTDGNNTANITSLPLHTRKEVVFGKIMDALKGKIDGFSIGTDLRTPPSYGYMVGGLSGEIKASELTSPEIRGKVNQLFVEASGKADIYIGGWRNGNDVVVELSEWCPSLESAMFAGSMRKQIAVYDLYNGKDILVESQANNYTKHEDY